MELFNMSDAMYGWSFVVVSALVFQAIGVFVSHYFTPDQVQKNKRWHWKNIAVSFIHSSLIGVLLIICFYLDPIVAMAKIDYHTTFSLSIVCFSVGYFIYDTIDMMRFHRERDSFELLLHHILIIFCFGITITMEKYVSYATVALVVEMNAVFLHARQLMRLYQVPRMSIVYRVNGLVNLGTFILFRIGVLAWMTRWIIANQAKVPVVLCAIVYVGIAIMTVINIVLFYRLLLSDYIPKKAQIHAQ